jgi:hypothetical protein
MRILVYDGEGEAIPHEWIESIEFVRVEVLNGVYSFMTSRFFPISCPAVGATPVSWFPLPGRRSSAPIPQRFLLSCPSFPVARLPVLPW